jgi:hypothetical protein
MYDESLNCWHQAFGDEHGLKIQNARHLQQGGKTKIAAAFNPGDRTLRLPEATAQVRLSEAFGFTSLPNLILDICHSIFLNTNIA